MEGFLNVGSLLLGLIAWVLPIVSLVNYKNDKHTNWSTFSILSMISCILALYFQIANTAYLVKLEDWAAIGDLSGVTKFVSLILIVVTITLNATMMILYHEKADK